MRRSVLGVLVAVLVFAVSAAPAAAVKKRLVGNFDTPIQVFAPRGVPGSTLYVVQKGGEIIRRQKGNHRNVVLDIHGHVSGGSEQGLLSAVIVERKLFVYYTNNDGDSRVVRYTLNSGRGHVQAGSRKTVLRQNQPFDNHNGGTLQYHDGHLYLSLGDGGDSCDTAQSAQNLNSRLGKLLRKDANGWKIVGYGLRNPWRWSFDRKTGDIYIGDVGQIRREEVDFLPASKVGLPAENYGWNHFEGDLVDTCGSKDEGIKGPGEVIFPKYDYGRGVGSTVIGGYVFRGSNMPHQRGRYFFGDEGSNWIKTADARTLRDRRTLGFSVPFLYSFGENSKGDLYVVSGAGPVYKLVSG
ncbi:MAG TPA: PQQ-dependent sugar dehydrogenase [Gaiellaceae bacterium]|jgi:glucose/arabinose dehydrogenase|nr:PQQ-dependent sugar dehydrogenase [Gaiellaceae bacterium]